jgi:hypothetical protein
MIKSRDDILLKKQSCRLFHPSRPSVLYQTALGIVAGLVADLVFGHVSHGYENNSARQHQMSTFDGIVQGMATAQKKL